MCRLKHDVLVGLYTVMKGVDDVDLAYLKIGNHLMRKDIRIDCIKDNCAMKLDVSFGQKPC